MKSCERYAHTRAGQLANHSELSASVVRARGTAEVDFCIIAAYVCVYIYARICKSVCVYTFLADVLVKKFLGK